MALTIKGGCYKGLLQRNSLLHLWLLSPIERTPGHNWGVNFLGGSIIDVVCHWGVSSLAELVLVDRGGCWEEWAFEGNIRRADGESWFLLKPPSPWSLECAEWAWELQPHFSEWPPPIPSTIDNINQAREDAYCYKNLAISQQKRPQSRGGWASEGPCLLWVSEPSPSSSLY